MPTTQLSRPRWRDERRRNERWKTLDVRVRVCRLVSLCSESMLRVGRKLIVGAFVVKDSTWSKVKKGVQKALMM